MSESITTKLNKNSNYLDYLNNVDMKLPTDIINRNTMDVSVSNISSSKYRRDF